VAASEAGTPMAEALAARAKAAELAQERARAGRMLAA
jgi:hypothetical protein